MNGSLMTVFREGFGKLLPGFLASQFSLRTGACYICRLPLDILLDEIFSYLHVETILQIRQVSRSFYILTHEPVIWKRFLYHIKAPLPPIRPTFKYAMPATDHEVEELVTRALSLDLNWNRLTPTLYSTSYFTTYESVLDMKLLPGGKYLVASMKDVRSLRFSIVVIALDRPDDGRQLAKVPTETKAFHLQAHYMSFGKRKGIMISFIRKKFRGASPEGINISDYAADANIDSPVPFNYEAVTLHIPLDSLDALANPQLDPRSKEYLERAEQMCSPFCEVSFLESPIPIEFSALFHKNDRAHLCIVQNPNRVIIQELFPALTDKVGVLTLPDWPQFRGCAHIIVAARPVSGTRVMIIRYIAVDRVMPQQGPIYMVEFYALPATGQELSGADVRRLGFYQITGRGYIYKWHITEAPTAPSYPFPTNIDSRFPVPVSVFCESADREYGPMSTRRTENMHWAFFPEQRIVPATATTPEKTRWIYTARYSKEMAHLLTHTIPGQPVLSWVPGINRSLAYMVPPTNRTDNPPLLYLLRYCHPRNAPDDYTFELEQNDADMEGTVDYHRAGISTRLPPPVRSHQLLTSLRLPPELAEHLRTDGLQSITWDEGIGRICLALQTKDGYAGVHVLDFSGADYTDYTKANKTEKTDQAMET